MMWLVGCFGGEEGIGAQEVALGYMTYDVIYNFSKSVEIRSARL